MNTAIKPLYGRLRGLKEAAPEETTSTITDENLWASFNRIVDLLNSATKADKYEDFRINPEYRSPRNGIHGYYYMKTTTYRSKLNELIGCLHAEYFQNDADPYTEVPSTIINQLQSQQQSQSMQSTVLHLQEKLIEKLTKEDTTENEKGFLKKLKELLPTIKDAVQLSITVAKLAKEFGVSPDILT